MKKKRSLPFVSTKVTFKMTNGITYYGNISSDLDKILNEGVMFFKLFNGHYYRDIPEFISEPMPDYIEKTSNKIDKKLEKVQLSPIRVNKAQILFIMQIDEE